MRLSHPALVLAMLAMSRFGCGLASGEAGTAYPLDAEGFVRNWLLAGPYPNPPAEPEPAGFAGDPLKHLGGEANIVPYAGLTDRAVFVADKAKLIAGLGATNPWGFTETRELPVTWTVLQWDDEDPIIPLEDRFGEIRDWLVAYAACWIESPSDRNVHLRVGSDDGYVLYLNHQRLGGFSASRAAAKDQNVHPGALRAGLNLILLKVTDRTGGHAFCLRVTDAKGKPYDDLKVVLEHPRVKYAAACENVDEVDVVDREGFARIRLGKEPRFPGELPLSLMVGTAEAKQCRVHVLVTDGADREVLSREFAAGLSLSQATAFAAKVSVYRPGDATVGVLVKDAKGDATIAHLSRTFQVLDPPAVRQQRDTLRRQLADREARKKTLEGKLRRQREAVASVRRDVATQYEQVEALYAGRRGVLAKRLGAEAQSTDEPFTPASAQRETVCLNGDDWQMVAATPRQGYAVDEERPPGGGWEPGWVPMLLSERYFRNRFFPVTGKGNAYGPSDVKACAPDGWTLSDVRIADGVWYRTTIEVPERWQGRRVLFTSEYAIHRVKVFLDGKLCGMHEGWPGRINIELSGATPGSHELLVLVQRARSYKGLTRRQTQCFGLVGDVFLESVPDVAVVDTWVITSWRDATIEARVWLRNRATKKRTVTLDCQTVLKGRTRLRLGSRDVTLAPGSVSEVRFEKPWIDPELWGIGGEYGQPTLYHLATTVKESEEVLDQHFTRFGFREFWREGFHFYLNGKRVFLQGDNPGFRVTGRPYQVLWQNLLRQACNVNTIRTHFELQQGMYARVADELGMLVIPQWYARLNVRSRSKETGGSQFFSVEEFLTTEEHRDNLRLYANWVKWLRNHPSVVIYSTDNEIFTQAWDTPEKLEANIRNDRLGAVYGRFVKELDPTRLVTRDGDEGTWGKMGKWQEDPPADIANYHYPDFNTAKLVENWESLYEKPALFGETLYCAYGAWDGWIDAVPSQVAAKAQRCRQVLSLYRDLEVPGWIGMGPGLDCFTELKNDGSGNPWGVSPTLRDKAKADGRVPELPHYPYFPVDWPSRSGVGLKPEFHRFLSTYGYGSVNAYDADRPVYVPNSVNAAYKECARPMPPPPPTRPTEVVVAVTGDGKPLPHATVVLAPKAGQACAPTAVRADGEGRAWFVLAEPGAYEARVEGRPKSIPLDVKDVPFKFEAGFGYLPRVTLEVGS